MAVVHPEPVSEDFNIVLLGSFNPDWFVRHGLAAKVVVVSRDVTEFSLIIPSK